MPRPGYAIVFQCSFAIIATSLERIYVTGLRKPVFSTQNTPIHIMISISFSVCAIQNLSLIEFLINQTSYVGWKKADQI